MNEAKKGFRAKKHRVASIEPSKPRNFVAKNAIQGGAGAHKDKKKAMKQGDTKHKKSYAEHLDSMLHNALTETRQINETGLDPVRRMKAIQFIVHKTGWERNYVELASDEELIDLYVKLKKGEPVGEAWHDRRDAWQRDYDSSRTGFGRGGREDDEYHVPDPDPEFQRNRQETMMYNVTVDGKPVNEKPMLGRSAALAWAKQEVAAGKLDPKVAKLSPVQYNEHIDDGDYDPEYDDEGGMADNNLETMKRAVAGLDELIGKGDNLPEWCQEKIAVAKSMLVTVWDYMASEKEGVSEGSKVDRQAMHITKSMMKRHGMSRDEAEAAAWAHIKHPKKKKKNKRMSEGNDLDQYDLDQLQGYYSDFNKDLLGFRPRGASEEEWNDPEWLKAQINKLHDYFDKLKSTPQGRAQLKADGWHIDDNAHEGWTHDSLAAQLFEQELTYEDQLNSMLAKKLQK